MNKIIKIFLGMKLQWIIITYTFLASFSFVFYTCSAEGDTPINLPNENNILVQYLTSRVWKNILLITDKDEYSLLRQLSGASIMFQLLKLSGKHNTAVLLKYFRNSYRSRVVVYCKTQCQQQVLLLHHGLFCKRISWLFVFRSFQTLDIFVSLKRFRHLLRIDSEVFSMVNLAEDQSHVFRVPFSSEEDVNSSAWHPIGSYSKQSWSLNHEYRSYYALQSHILLFGILHEIPGAIIEEKGTITEYGGLFVELVRMLSKYIGFSHKFVIERTGAYGSLSANGSWTGFMGMLLEKKIDVASMALALTKDRLTAADFTAYIMEANTMGMYRKPSQDTATINLFTYSQPFPQDVWFLLAVTLAFIFICLTCSTTNEIRGQHTDLWFLLRVSVNHTLWTIISFLIKMGLTHLPTQGSGRVILLFSVFFVLVINSTYNGLLTSFLTVRKEISLFNNFDDVLEDGTYNFAVCYHSAQHRALETAKEGTFQRVWKKMASDPTSLVATIEDGIEKVYKEKYVFIQEHVTLEHLAAEDCSLTVIKQTYLKLTGHFVLQKHSQYLEIFSQKLLVMRSSGILNKELNKYYTKPNPGDCSPRSPISSVRLLEAAGAPAFLLLGLFSSVFCFLLEIIVDKWGQAVWLSRRHNQAEIQAYSESRAFES